MLVEFNYENNNGTQTQTVSVPEKLYVKKDIEDGEIIFVSTEPIEDDKTLYNFETITVGEDNKEIMAYYYVRDVASTLSGYSVIDSLINYFTPIFDNKTKKWVLRKLEKTDTTFDDAIASIGIISNLDDATKQALISTLEALKSSAQ